MLSRRRGNTRAARTLKRQRNLSCLQHVPPEERYGNFTMSQFSAKDCVKTRQCVFNLSNAIPAEERQDRYLPQTVEDVNTFGMVWFVEVMAIESHGDFMMTYPIMTDTDSDHDEFHDMQLKCKRIMDENEHIHISTSEEEDNPVIPKDPTNKKEIEHMTPENKQLILETDNSALIDCAVQWMNMLDKDLQKMIVDRISFVVKKEEGEEEVKDYEVTEEPVVPPATRVSMETQTDFPEESEKPGSSQQREGTEEKKKDINVDDTAP